MNKQQKGRGARATPITLSLKRVKQKNLTGIDSNLMYLAKYTTHRDLDGYTAHTCLRSPGELARGDKNLDSGMSERGAGGLLLLVASADNRAVWGASRKLLRGREMTNGEGAGKRARGGN